MWIEFIQRKIKITKKKLIENSKKFHWITTYLCHYLDISTELNPFDKSDDELTFLQVTKKLFHWNKREKRLLHLEILILFTPKQSKQQQLSIV